MKSGINHSGQPFDGVIQHASGRPSLPEIFSINRSLCLCRTSITRRGLRALVLGRSKAGRSSSPEHFFGPEMSPAKNPDSITFVIKNILWGSTDRTKTDSLAAVRERIPVSIVGDFSNEP
jgi:hypothetical protein